MFYNTPNGFHLETENGWTISISIAGHEVWESCEIAVWHTGVDDQQSSVRWGANGAEPPDFPVFDRVLRLDSTAELLRVMGRLSQMAPNQVQPNKWLSTGLARESIWR